MATLSGFSIYEVFRSNSPDVSLNLAETLFSQSGSFISIISWHLQCLFSYICLFSVMATAWWAGEIINDKNSGDIGNLKNSHLKEKLYWWFIGEKLQEALGHFLPFSHLPVHRGYTYKLKHIDKHQYHLNTEMRCFGSRHRTN